jgi:hypothetical protein
VISAARVGEHSEVEWNCVYRSPAFAIRSSAGVGMTPPNVLGAPKPQSSVMIKRMFGAPLGGTTVGGHHAFDSEAFSLMTPPNFGSGGGSCFPSMVVVALGEPGTPVVWMVSAAMHTPIEKAVRRTLMPNDLQRLGSSGLLFGFRRPVVFMLANVSAHLGRKD